ncbi:MAG: AAA family ATPase, partial [Thermotogaceae bacterium]|nr:AAA family ATPase [Thermotogaceae bacterium]
MIVKKEYIKGFGKLKNTEIEFDPALNVIYGENASGKTTMSKFLLFALAGFTKTEIQRYKPWVGSEFGGQVDLVKDSGEEFSVSLDPESSEHAPLFNRSEFETMSYIPEEGSIDISKGMEGSIIAKLKSRMVKLKSMEKLVNLINREREIFEDLSIKESKISQEIESIQEEINELKERYEEEKNLRKRFVLAIKRLKSVEKDLEKLEKLLISSKARVAKELWKKMDELRVEISNLGVQISDLKKYSNVDEDKIERIKKLDEEMRRMEEEIENLERKKDLKIAEIAKIKEHIKKLEEDLKIGENENFEAVELKIRNLDLSLKLYKEKVSMSEVPDKWKSFESLENVEERMSRIRNMYVELKSLMEEEHRTDEELKNLEGEFKYARFKIHSRRILVLVFAAFAAGIFGISFLTEFFLLLTVTASVSVGITLALWISTFDLKKVLSNIENEKMKIKLNKEVIQDKIKRVKSELFRQTSLFGFEDYETLLNEYNVYKQWKNGEGKYDVYRESMSKVEEELKAGLLEFYDEISNDYEGLISNLKDKVNLYVRLRERMGNLNLDVERIKNRLSDLKGSLLKIKDEYNEALREFECNSVDDCFSIVEKKRKYYELVKERESLEEKLKVLKSQWDIYKEYRDLDVKDENLDPPEVIQEKIENLKERKAEIERNVAELE